MSLGNRHAHFRVIRTFLRWLEREYGISSTVSNLKGPRLPRLILPSLTTEQILTLIGEAGGIRNQAIIALATESGLRASELASIEPHDIDWEMKVIRTLGKGGKEAYAPFGKLSEQYLIRWLNEYEPNGNIWGINKDGIQTMLRRLQEETGLPCNPHTSAGPSPAF